MESPEVRAVLQRVYQAGGYSYISGGVLVVGVPQTEPQLRDEVVRVLSKYGVRFQVEYIQPFRVL
jgi:hypothetical protein